VLACETALVASAALFFSMTLAQLVPAIAATPGCTFWPSMRHPVDRRRPLAEASLPHQAALGRRRNCAAPARLER